MAGITREEFKKIYDEKFVPMLEKLEPERVETLKKAKKWSFIVGLSLFFIISMCFLFNFINSTSSGEPMAINLEVFFQVVLLSVIPALVVYGAISSPINVKLKQEVIPKVLSMYGNLYFSQNTEVIDLQEMKSLGLFPRATTKNTDDVIIGAHKGFNFVISEASYVNNVLEGEYKEFFETGKIKSTAIYEQDALNGLTLIYDEEGNLSYEVPYVRNRKQGKVKRYYPTGELMGEVSYEKGKKHGMLDAFNQDGTLMAKVLFNKDKAIKGYSLDHGKKPVLMTPEELELINKSY